MPITQDTIESLQDFKDPLLRKRYAFLWRHPQIKKIFFAPESADIILEIAKKYHLPVEKMRCLAKTAGLVLLGEIKIQDFEKKIQESCNFIPETASMISQEINNKIFNKIKQFLESPQETENHDKIKQDLAEHDVIIKKPQHETIQRSTIY